MNMNSNTYQVFIEKISIETAYNFYTGKTYNKHERFCPFCGHQDCFSIFPSKTNNKVCLYKCHSCKKTSNVIGFLKELTQIKNTNDFCNKIIHDFNLDYYIDNYINDYQYRWIPAPPIPAPIISPPTPTPSINFWPTITDCINFKDTCWAYMDVYPYYDFSYYKEWCNYRGFSKSEELYENAVGILYSHSFLFPQPSKFKNAFQQSIYESIQKKQQLEIHNIGVPIQNIEDKLVAVQFLVLPKFLFENKKGKTLSKLFTRAEAGESAKGFTVFIGNHYDTFPFDYGKFIIVESVANALALSMIGLNTICIYTTGNIDLIPELKLKYNDVVLWLDRDAQIIKENERFSLQEQACRDYDVEGIYFDRNTSFWKDEKPSNYDINDLFNETICNSGSNNYFYIIQEYLQQAPFLSYYTENTIYEALTERLNTIHLILAPTGVGKTTTLIQKLQDEDRYNTIFTYTVKNAMFLKHQLEKYSCIVSNNTGLEDDGSYGDNITGFEIATIARLNYWGHSPYLFPCAPFLLNKNYFYIDEAHNLFNFYHFNYALCACYEKPIKSQKKVKSERYESVSLFSHNLEKHFDTTCTRENKYRQFGFMYEATNQTFHILESFAGHTVKEWIENKELYKHVIDTVFACELENQLNIDTMPNPDDVLKSKFTGSYFDFLKELLTKTLKPRITIEMPIYKETNEPLSYQEYIEEYKEIENKLRNEIIQKYTEQYKLPENVQPPAYLMGKIAKEIDKEQLKQNVQRELNKIIKFPQKAPWIPYFSGYNILPFLLLLENPRAINMLTATMSEKHIKLLKEISILKNYNLNIVKIPYIPVKYNVTILMLDKDLTNKQQAKLLELLDKQKAPPMLSVSYKKYNAKDVKTKLFSKILGENFLFYEDKYFSTRGDVENDKEQSPNTKNRNEAFHIITYSKASILEGYNMPFHEIAIIDAGIFIAKANMDLNTYASDTEKLYQYNMHANNEIKQIAGRLFRPLPEEEEQIQPNRTLISKKHIVLFLHNTEQLKHFRLDYEIINGQPTIIKETDTYSFASIDGERRIDTICEAILNAYERKEIINQKEIDNEIRQQEREQALFEKQQQQEEIWRNKASQLKEEGVSYIDAYKIMHASRYESLQRILKEMFSQGEEGKQQQQEAKWKAKALALKKEGFSYQEVYRKMNASRYESLQEILLEIFCM